MRKPILLVKIVLLATLLLFPTGTSFAQGGGPSYTAYAEFLVNPTGCHQTHATITVIEETTHTPPGPPQSTATVELTYAVRSTCAEVGDLLFYYDIHTVGAVTIDADDFTVHKGLKWANLHTTVPVFDEESGTSFDFGVDVSWTTSKGGGATSTEAVFEFFGVNLTATPYIVNPLTDAVSAELSRLS